MGILDKLESIFHVDLSGLRNLQNKVKIDFQLFSNNNNKKFVNKGTIIIISPDALKKGESVGLQSVIREVNKERIPLLQNDILESLENFKKIDSASNIQNLISFFKGKVPASDLEILRQSNYIKVAYDRGERVGKFKAELVSRYGMRGRNICNLYGTGYFESQIIPLYNEMVGQQNFSPRDFEAAYERIVMESPYAIFIYGGMSNQEAVDEVKKKILRAKKYGIKYLNIHGIGQDNVEKITYLLDKLRPEFSSPEEIIRLENVITVKIQF